VVLGEKRFWTCTKGWCSVFFRNLGKDPIEPPKTKVGVVQLGPVPRGIRVSWQSHITRFSSWFGIAKHECVGFDWFHEIIGTGFQDSVLITLGCCTPW
jgi:hypothetical protein